MSDSDDLPLGGPGNVYDPLFADRINRLGRGPGRADAGPGGMAWPGLVVGLLIIGILRGVSYEAHPLAPRPPEVTRPGGDELLRPLLGPDALQHVAVV